MQTPKTEEMIGRLTIYHAAIAYRARLIPGSLALLCGIADREQNHNAAEKTIIT